MRTAGPPESDTLMQRWQWNRRLLISYLVATLGALAVVFWSHQLWQVEDWRTPLSWHQGGDALFNVLLAQNIEETGWYQENPRLGAPEGLELYDWPGSVLVPMAGFKLLGIFLDSPGAIVNLYYLLGWPLAAIAALWAFLRLGISPPLATGLALTFAALPAHAMRGEPHLFLASLAFIPPAIVVAYELARNGLTLRGRVWALAFALVLGASDAYYGFFAATLVGVGGATGWLTSGGGRRLLDALAFGLATAAGLIIAILPSLLYGDRSIVVRSEAEAGILGLKLGQLLLPVPGHRFEPFSRLTRHYIEAGSAPGLQNESLASALGLLAALGLLILIVHLLGGRLTSRNPESLSILARLALAAVLFATVGGFGSLFVTFVSAQIRAYNRISVFVGFVALAGLGVVLTAVVERLPAQRRQPVAWTLAVLLALFGAWDQSSIHSIPRYQLNAASWAVDRDWVGRAEAALPKGTMVFQLPWVPFPESPRQERLFNYDWLRPILHSRSLRWSYGAMKQSKADLWQRSVVVLPTAEIVAKLRAEKFGAIALDRWGYADEGHQLVVEFAASLGPPKIESTDGRWVLFSLDAGAAARPPAAN